MMTLESSRATSFSLRLASILGILAATTIPTAYASPADEARQIASLTGFHGGLVVHVDCGDGKLTAALRLAENCVVQGLETDAGRVKRARAAIRALGVYGPVSVVHWSGKKLPYVDNLATLVVCENPDVIPPAELTRVVRPHGAAVVKRNGTWTVTVKPQVPGTDQWEQHYRGADNNAVSQDTVVGPPRRYQWLGEPQWQRSHLAMPSINSMVSTKGRLFTVEDLGSAEHPALPGKQALVARDAFNGVILWRVMFSDWHPIYIRNKEMPVQIQRRLAAVGDVVYCTPGYSAPITVFNAATGAVIKEHARTAGTMEFVHDRGVLYVVTGDQSDISAAHTDLKRSALNKSLFRRRAYGPAIRQPADPKNDILAIDATSGKELWRLSGTSTKGYEGATLGATGDRVVFATAKELVCLNRATGNALWRVPAPIVLKGPAGIAVSLVLSDSAAYLADSERLRAFRLADGKGLWETPATINHHKAPDVFLANGLVWAAAYSASTGRLAPALGLNRLGVNGFDPKTGKLVKQLNQTMVGPMGHDRCYRNRITTRFYINTATGGSDFLELRSSKEFPNPWIRSTCGIGPLPCNGLYYVGPPSCACCNSVMLNGMNALAAEPGFSRSDQPINVRTESTLEKGPAFSEISKLKSPTADSPADWPVFRHDNARTGTTKNRVPAVLGKRWSRSIPLTGKAIALADDVLFVAGTPVVFPENDLAKAYEGRMGCILWAASAATGEKLAQYTLDAPPAWDSLAAANGMLFLSLADGRVVCMGPRKGP